MRLFFSALILTLPLAASLAHADVVELPANTTDNVTAVSKPSKGQSLQSVLRAYGAPSKKYPPVGGGHPKRPPITRWDYPAFSVFFEHGHVVDAVVPGHPPTIHHADELMPTAR